MWCWFSILVLLFIIFHWPFFLSFFLTIKTRCHLAFNLERITIIGRPSQRRAYGASGSSCECGVRHGTSNERVTIIVIRYERLLRTRDEKRRKIDPESKQRKRTDQLVWLTRKLAQVFLCCWCSWARSGGRSALKYHQNHSMVFNTWICLHIRLNKEYILLIEKEKSEWAYLESFHPNERL